MKMPFRKKRHRLTYLLLYVNRLDSTMILFTKAGRKRNKDQGNDFRVVKVCSQKIENMVGHNST